MAMILATYKKDYSNYILGLQLLVNLNRDLGTSIYKKKAETETDDTVFTTYTLLFFL